MKYFIVFITVSAVLVAHLTVCAASSEADSKDSDANSDEDDDDYDDDDDDDDDDYSYKRSVDTLQPEVVTYINTRLDKLLNKNPEKSSAEFQLANVFNNERNKLDDSKLSDDATQADEAKAEQLMENFQKFIMKFEKIEEKLKTAVENLEYILDDDNTAMKQKYETLNLISDLKESKSFNMAEKNLRKFNRYMKNHHTATAPAFSSHMRPFEHSPTTAPALSHEYKVYLDEIKSILKCKIYGIPKMLNYLEQLLENPKQLKKLAETLEDFLNDEYDDIFDY